MIVRVTTELPIAAETAYELAQKPAVFRHVVKPILGIGRTPDHLDVGDEIATRLYLFGFIPAWKHHLKLVSLNPNEIFSNESGGPITTWNHRLCFEPITATSCRYTDVIDIEAGIATLPTTLFAHLLFRWRQRRWRALTKLLA